MRIILIAAATLMLSAAPLFAQAPASCSPNASGEVDYAACARDASEGSLERPLALMNLGAAAFLNGDVQTAVQYYDAAQPSNGQRIYSDASYHSYHASALQQVGRPDEAIAEARVALAIIRRSPDLPAGVVEAAAQAPLDLEVAYALLLPVLHAAHDPETESVRREFMAIQPRDWVSWTNRAGVLAEIGDVENALEANAPALREQPEHTGVLNNQCYILALANRAAEALPFCQRAVSGAPDMAQTHHSYAVALAASGRCAEAEAELAEARRLDATTPDYQNALTCAG